MKTSFLFTICTFVLLSCKNDSNNQSIKETEITSVDTIKDEIVIPNNDEDCYNYLTELIRSSDFPFGKIKKEKVNTIIDEDNGEIIRAKLFFDTDGTGTIGWVEYHLKERKLFNSSANLEEPEPLKFDIDYAKKLESCKGMSGIKTAEDSNNKSIESLYKTTKLVSLPNKYNYDFMIEEKDFIKVPAELYTSFDFENYSNFKIAKLPVEGNIKPVFFIIYDESGQLELYLITLDSDYKIIDKLKLYNSEEIEGGSLSTTYEISKDYKIKIKEAKLVGSGSKVIEKDAQTKNYKMNSSGKIESL